MSTGRAKLTIHMVSSLDGYVAREDNDVSWMDCSWRSYDKGVEVSMDVLETIDGYIVGSRTYELALKLGWPYGDKTVIVVTERELPSARESVEFYSGDLEALVAKLGEKNMWLVGGPTLYQEFLRLELVDEICLTIVPIFLGSGLALFKGDQTKLRLKETSAFKNGMVDMWYEVVRANKASG